jgi:hypothetical protein
VDVRHGDAVRPADVRVVDEEGLLPVHMRLCALECVVVELLLVVVKVVQGGEFACLDHSNDDRLGPVPKVLRDTLVHGVGARETREAHDVLQVFICTPAERDAVA